MNYIISYVLLKDIHNEVLSTLEMKEQLAIKQHKAMQKLEKEYEEKVCNINKQCM